MQQLDPPQQDPTSQTQNDTNVQQLDPPQQDPTSQTQPNANTQPLTQQAQNSASANAPSVTEIARIAAAATAAGLRLLPPSQMNRQSNNQLGNNAMATANLNATHPQQNQNLVGNNEAGPNYYRLEFQRLLTENQQLMEMMTHVRIDWTQEIRLLQWQNHQIMEAIHGAENNLPASLQTLQFQHKQIVKTITMNPAMVAATARARNGQSRWHS